MRPLVNIEILWNEKNKNVYIYKLEQEYFKSKHKDIRDIVDDILLKIYVYKNLNFRVKLSFQMMKFIFILMKYLLITCLKFTFL
jgi:hypothetical protein